MNCISHRGPILHLVWNLIRGGTEGQCARTVMALASRGWSQRVGVSRREGFFLSEVERVCGPVHEVRIEHLLRVRTFLEVRDLVRFIRRERIALVHAWDADAAIFGAAAARWAGVPLITSRRDLGDIYAPRKRRLMRWADSHAKAVVVNARAIADAPACAHIRRDQVHIIPNMLDVGEFDARAKHPVQPLPPLPKGRLIAMVARLDPEKDVGTCLRAFVAVRAAHPDARLLIVGDGRERAALESLAHALRIASDVFFIGECNEVPHILAHCCAGVLVPSRNEGLSNTIMEYMAAGLPVVATDCGGNRELVFEGESGRLVPIGDAGALGSALIELLDRVDVARAYGAAGRRRIVESHQPSSIGAAFAELYASLLKSA